MQLPLRSSIKYLSKEATRKRLKRMRSSNNTYKRLREYIWHFHLQLRIERLTGTLIYVKRSRQLKAQKFRCGVTGASGDWNRSKEKLNGICDCRAVYRHQGQRLCGCVPGGLHPPAQR